MARTRGNSKSRDSTVRQGYRTAEESASLEKCFQMFEYYLMQQRIDSAAIKNLVQNLQGSIGSAQPTNPEMESAVNARPVIRYSLAEATDIQKIPSSHKDIVSILKQRTGGWENILGVKLTPGTLFLFPKAWEWAKQLRQRADEIQSIFELSKACHVLEDHYEVVALGYEFTRNSLPAPADFVGEWAAHNEASITRASWRQNQLILGIGDLGDVEKLCRSPTVFLSGQVGIVRPFDHRSLPMFCYIFWAPGHKQNVCDRKPRRYGKCSMDHDTNQCRAREHKCPNCHGAHAAWSQNCTDKKVVAMRKQCSSWFRRGPNWTHRDAGTDIGSNAATTDHTEVQQSALLPDDISSNGNTKSPKVGSSTVTPDHGEVQQPGSLPDDISGSGNIRSQASSKRKRSPHDDQPRKQSRSLNKPRAAPADLPTTRQQHPAKVLPTAVNSSLTKGNIIGGSSSPDKGTGAGYRTRGACNRQKQAELE